MRRTHNLQPDVIGERINKLAMVELINTLVIISLKTLNFTLLDVLSTSNCRKPHLTPFIFGYTISIANVCIHSG